MADLSLSKGKFLHKKSVRERAALSGGGILGGDRHIRRGGSGVEWCGDACVARWGRGKALMGPGRGRRKRPLPAQPNPRPYGYEGASEAVSHQTTPRGRPRSSLPMFVCYMRNK